MYIILLGCGRTGQRIARMLANSGVDLVLIDNDVEALSTLDDLDLVRIQGVSIDLEVLEMAGIRDASAVIALHSDENTNIMACQIAKEIYGVKHVVARTFTPENEDFYHGLGLTTVCSTALNISRTMQVLGFRDFIEE